jgi:hypothetical protein
MRSRNVFAAIAMACLLAVGLLGIAPVANTESRGESFLKPGKSANFRHGFAMGAGIRQWQEVTKSL